MTRLSRWEGELAKSVERGEWRSVSNVFLLTLPARDSEPRPRTIIDWLVWLTLWPVATVAWLIAVPLVLV